MWSQWERLILGYTFMSNRASVQQELKRGGDNFFGHNKSGDVATQDHFFFSWSKISAFSFHVGFTISGMWSSGRGFTSPQAACSLERPFWRQKGLSREQMVLVDELSFGQPFFPSLIANTMDFMGFFSQTLTTLHLGGCSYPFFLSESVWVWAKWVQGRNTGCMVSCDNYPDKLCSEQKAPGLEYPQVPLLAYPCRTNGRSHWHLPSFSPFFGQVEEVACLQPILDEPVMLYELHLIHCKRSDFKLL